MIKATIFIITVLISVLTIWLNELMAQTGITALSPIVVTMAIIALSGIVYLTLNFLKAVREQLS